MTSRETSCVYKIPYFKKIKVQYWYKKFHEHTCLKRDLIISHLLVILSSFDVNQPSVDERLIYTYWIKLMKVETTNLTSRPLCLAVVGIRTWEVTVQVRDRNLHITNRHTYRLFDLMLTFYQNNYFLKQNISRRYKRHWVSCETNWKVMINQQRHIT